MQSWQMAQDIGGHLVTLTSQQESAFVGALTSTPRGIDIGGFQDRSAQSYSEPAGGWRWVTGETWDYTNWLMGEPNNVDPGEDFLFFSATNQYQDGWGDGANFCPPCEPHFFAVEWSADCNADGIIDYGQILAGQLVDANANNIPDACESDLCAPQGSFARFADANSTIKILGNTAFPSTDFTYECRIRIVPGALLGHIVYEHTDSVEAKLVAVSPSNFFGYMVRGFNCGNQNDVAFVAPVGVVWHHLAWVRDGSVARLYVDGAFSHEWASQANCLSDSAGSRMSLGMHFQEIGGAYARSFTGDLDWIRISAGARYTGNFVPPRECDLASDAATQLLLRFNEPTGTSVLTDESPSQFQCIMGESWSSTATGVAPALLRFGIDFDGDGVDDSSDAFPLDATEWLDTDGDGVGNNADTDDDNDGFVDASDAFPLDASEWIDSDNDGVGNNADTDDDNDGVDDWSDAFPFDASEWLDSDNDGTGNNADSDDDNDGTDDALDGCPLDSNKTSPGQCGCGASDIDTDADGTADCVEVPTGAVRAWGNNEYGQCSIPSDLGVCAAIAGHGSHTVALQSAGLVRAWGWNFYGQCDTPSDLGNCSAISSGAYHTIALQSSGLVRAWG